MSHIRHSHRRRNTSDLNLLELIHRPHTSYEVLHFQGKNKNEENEYNETCLVSLENNPSLKVQKQRLSEGKRERPGTYTTAKCFVHTHDQIWL